MMTLFNKCDKIENEKDFHRLLKEFGEYLGFEFVFYGYSASRYSKGQTIRLANVSYPKEWLNEYVGQGYCENDPVKLEMEKRMAANCDASVILWEDCKKNLTKNNIFDKCKPYGLEYGCSAYDSSKNKDYSFLISFASKTTKPDERIEFVCGRVVSHITMTRKKLDILMLVNQMTCKERIVANWMKEGKTNWEIAQILNISHNTVKYHSRNIFAKLNVTNRQQLVSIMMAAQFLSP
jgi:DNA-binding CsgD family transcriptional regulator